jgi:hypothetical protein
MSREVWILENTRYNLNLYKTDLKIAVILNYTYSATWADNIKMNLML